VPLLMWASFLLIGATTQGYDLVTRPASDLGAHGSANAGLFNLGFFYIPGLLCLVFTAALAELARPASLPAAILVTAGAVSLLISGLFRVDPSSPSATHLHQAVGISFVTAMPLAPIVVAFSAARRTSLQRYAALSAAIGGGLVIVAVLSVALPENARPSSGVFQRCSAVLETAWFWLTAWALVGQVARRPVFQARQTQAKGPEGDS
jgi:hypothetical membrane protein